MNIRILLLIICILAAAYGVSTAEIFKWVDENGVTHYSDSPTHRLSEAKESETEEIESAQPAPSGSPPPASVSRSGDLAPDFFDILDENRKEEAVAVQTPKVEIYETDWCGYCKKAKKFFRSRGIDVTVYNIEKDPRAARRMRSMTKRRAVPYVVIDGQGIQGYSEELYTRALQRHTR